jgi:hypothetical protein
MHELEKSMKPEGTLMKHNREEAIQLAYDLGHLYELGAHYCPQASLAALMDVFHIRDDTLFKSVFGFHGGSGNSGIGPCGALAGGITAIGYFYGRCRTEFDMMVENCTATPLVNAAETVRRRCSDGRLTFRRRRIYASLRRTRAIRNVPRSLERERPWLLKSSGMHCRGMSEQWLYYAIAIESS